MRLKFAVGQESCGGFERQGEDHRRGRQVRHRGAGLDVHAEVAGSLGEPVDEHAVERGEFNITLNALLKIATALNTPAWQLLRHAEL